MKGTLEVSQYLYFLLIKEQVCLFFRLDLHLKVAISIITLHTFTP